MKTLVNIEKYTCTKGEIVVNTYKEYKKGEGKYGQTVNCETYEGSVFLNGVSLFSTGGFTKQSAKRAWQAENRKNSIIDMVMTF